MKPVFCIRHQPTVPLGVISDAFDAAGVAWRYVDAWRGEALPDLDEARGLVVLGGEMNADSVAAHPWLADVRALLRAAVDRQAPVLGVCLGAQLLARALDAEVAPAAAREIGFRKVSVASAGLGDPLLAPFAPASLVFQWHEDECALPTGAELLATNDAVAVQAYRVGERAYGVQFHFEVTEQQISDWCDDTRPEGLRDVWGATRAGLFAQAASHLAVQQEAGRRLVQGWVELLG